VGASRLRVNNLPPYIKDISSNVKKFENCLKRFLHIHSFYSLEEYFQHNLSTSWKCFHFSTIIIIMLVKCVICSSVFHSLNVWHSYLTSSSVCSYVCDCQFCNYGCPMYLVIQGFCSSTVSNNTYVWLGISLIPKTNVIYVSYGILWTCSIS